MDIRSALLDSDLSAARDAIEALDAGWQVLEPSPASNANELKRIYRLREKGLRKFSSPHAKQLREASSELLQRLEGAGTVRSITMIGPAEYQFLLFIDAEASSVIGCIRTISKLDVDADRWESIWRG